MAPVAPAAQSASAASSPVLAAVRDDPYDSAKMDYKPSAAALSSDRHTGAFASGASVNMQAALAPLDPSPIKEVRLDTTHKIIEIAPGVRFSAWTFEAGNYVMVDHHFANASQGTIGIIAAGGSAGDPEHHNIPATASPTDASAIQGKLAFESKCLACHSIAGRDKLGPDLHGATKRHDDVWLTRWLKSPEQMLQTDPLAKAMLDKYKVPMPNQGLSEEEIKQYLAYFKWADQNVQPKGSSPAHPSSPETSLPPSQTKSAAPAATSAGARQ
jgi:mono/diheme cytochrome c family protein